MRKTIALLSFISILLAASFFAFPIKGSVQPIHTGPTVELTEKLLIGQTFISSQRNLERIDLYMTGGKQKRTGFLILRLYENGPGGVLLRTARAQASGIHGDQYVKFKIKPLHDSRGRRLFMTLDAARTRPQDLRIWFYSDESAYLEGQGYANAGLLHGDIKFRTYHRLNFFAWVAEYGQRLSAEKPFPAGNTAIDLLLIALIFGGFAFLIAQIFDEGKQEPRAPL